MQFINNNITFWPGGKPAADSVINSIGDILSSIIGWYFMDKYMSQSLYYLMIAIVIYFWID
jgi:hypothetical protein